MKPAYLLGAVLLCLTTAVQSQQTYRFTPTAFYTTYSFAHPPALRIRPGDRVITKTIDAAGTDWNNKTVSLVKKKPIAWPRLETGTHIMVLGSARPLLEAFQIATSEMQRWLMADYGFSERGASTFMGQALEYEIANVVDPNFTVVAKMRKSMLPRPNR